jgi:hypothetical protein
VQDVGHGVAELGFVIEIELARHRCCVAGRASQRTHGLRAILPTAFDGRAI